MERQAQIKQAVDLIRQGQTEFINKLFNQGDITALEAEQIAAMLNGNTQANSVNFNHHNRPRISQLSSKKWIGIDLDGTLSESGKGVQGIGEPIQPMIDFIQKLRDKGDYEVKIFTARADSEDGINTVKDWLKKHKLPDLEVTNQKDRYTAYIVDDIAIRVKRNKGEICNECLESLGSNFSNHYIAQHLKGFY